jgi:murein DD-endopeptidase MepM/ murein hydrolase activator NlpD
VSAVTASIAAPAAPAGRFEPVGPDDAPIGSSLFVLPPSEAFLWPVAGGLTRSGFGPRHGRLHAGLDISAPTGFDVVAAREGTVVYSGNKFQGYGNVVMIDHGDGYVTVYAHNAENLVEEGDSVDRGEIIAKVGATGNATGSHCHFEVRKDNVAIDPLRFLRTDPDAGVVAGAAVERSPSRARRSRAASDPAGPPIP